MLPSSLLHGLRHVLAHVTIGNDFPPSPDSTREIALLRAANRAMLRREDGKTDAFLFVMVGSYDADKVREVISAYGFPNISVITLDSDVSEAHLSIHYDEVCAEVGDSILSWLNKEHPGALARFSQEYQNEDFWWAGIEHDKDVFDWPFSAGDFASELPTTHRARAATWLAVLTNAAELDAIRTASFEMLGSVRVASWAATLCEWLHGFEAASGNGYNHFDADSVGKSLGLSDFYLGFELARLQDDDLDTLCDEHDVNLDELRPQAVGAISANLRGDLRSDLSDFFGGDSGLFFALYSSIWPQLAKPMVESSQELLQSDDHNDLAELDAPWRFVSEGWCDEADD